MGFWSRLGHLFTDDGLSPQKHGDFWFRLECWLFGPPPTITTITAVTTIQPVKRARPAAARAGSTAQQPGTHRSDKPELELLFPWLPDSELGRILLQIASILLKYAAWTKQDIPSDPWQQMFQWAMPLVLSRPERLSIKEKCALLRIEIANGLRTYNTPHSVLRQPVRILWLQQQGQRIEAAYRLLEQQPGYSRHAMTFVWWVIYGL